MPVVFDLPAAAELGQAAGGVEELSTALVALFASSSIAQAVPSAPFTSTGGATSAIELMRQLGELCQTVIPGLAYWSFVGRVTQAPSATKITLPADVNVLLQGQLAREMDAIEGQRAFWYAHAPLTAAGPAAPPPSVSPATDRGILGRLGLGIARAYQQWLGGGNKSVRNALERTLPHEHTLRRAVAGAGGLQGFPGPTAGAAQEAARAARQAFWAAFAAVAGGRHPDLREAVLALLVRRFAGGPPAILARPHAPAPVDMTLVYRLVASRAG